MKLVREKALLLINDHQNAELAYKKGININPNFQDSYYNMGLIFADEGKLDKAIEAFNKAISIMPDYAEAFYNLGIVLVTMGRLDDAIYAYKKAIENNPHYVNRDAYGDGWFVIIRVHDGFDFDDLLSSEDYVDYLAEL